MSELDKITVEKPPTSFIKDIKKDLEIEDIVNIRR